jgi:hypothetical protein
MPQERDGRRNRGLGRVRTAIAALGLLAAACTSPVAPPEPEPAKPDSCGTGFVGICKIGPSGLYDCVCTVSPNP